MSFIDPDLREQLAKDDAERKRACSMATYNKHDYPNGHEPCVRCGQRNPDADKPRVTLVADEYRAVFVPKENKVTVERRSRDTLGAERWDAVYDVKSENSRSEPSTYPTFLLLAKGRAP